tara:strand:+ start:1464 stop:1601 length:138 start_codon:yes stop_codon:yes gene_type:complete
VNSSIVGPVVSRDTDGVTDGVRETDGVTVGVTEGETATTTLSVKS